MRKDTGIPGDRGIAQMRGPRLLAQRLPHYVATGFMVAAGVGLLIAYYSEVSHRAKETASAPHQSARTVSRSEMKLPSLGVAPPPVEVPSPVSTGLEHSGLQLSPDALTSPSQLAAMSAGTTAARPPVYAAPVTIRATTLINEADSVGIDAIATRTERVLSPRLSVGADRAAPISVVTVAATVLPTQRWLLPKGSFLNCTLETAVDSTLPGLSTCVLGKDVFGADGRVVLLERGTRLIGEIKTDVRAGQARVVLLWNEARTPTGVVVSLQSPGTDALGRSGVPGEVDRHTGERFGAAVMLSLFDAGVTAVTTRSQGAGAIVYNAQASHDVASEALKDSIGIPPTIRVSTGARLSVIVMRDLDFRSVYGLVDHGD